MALGLVNLNIEYYPDPTVGRPVSNGSIYVGIPDLDPVIEANRVTVQIRQEGNPDVPILPAAQPLLTGGGGVILYNGSPAQLLVDGNYSLKVLNSSGVQVYYIPNGFSDAVSSTAAIVVPDKAAANSLTITNGRKVFITSADGGEFTMRTGQPIGTYNDNAGAFTGTKFTNGDGSSGIERNFNGDIFAHWFGTKADNTTDDSDALINAYSAAKIKNINLRIISGEYVFDKQLVWDAPKTSVIGDGENSTILVKRGSFDGILVTSSETDLSRFKVTSVNDPSNPNPPTTDTGHGIWFLLAQLGTVDRITTVYHGGHGIYVTQGIQHTYSNILSRYNSLSGMRFDAENSTMESPGWVNSNTLTNIDLLGNTDHGLSLEGVGNDVNFGTNIVCQQNGKHGLFVEGLANSFEFYGEKNDNITYFPGGTGDSLGVGTGGYWDLYVSSNAFKSFIKIISITSATAYYNAGVTTTVLNIGGTTQINTPVLRAPITSDNSTGNILVVSGGDAGAGDIGRAGGFVNISGGAAKGTTGQGVGGDVNVFGGVGVNGANRGKVIIQNNSDGYTIIGSDTPSSSTAVLELKSTSGGFIPPRMTEVQRDDIADPIEGMIIYNQNTFVLNYYNGSAWTQI